MRTAIRRRFVGILAAAATAACHADPTDPAAGTPSVAYLDPTAVAALTLSAPDGTNRRQLPLGAAADVATLWEPRWSPDGRQVAVLGSADGARRTLIVASVGGAPFATRIVATDTRASLGHFDWSPDGHALVATLTALDIHVPPGCAVANVIVTTAATSGAVPDTIYTSQGCNAPLPALGAIASVRWGADGRIYFVTASAAPGRSRVLVVDRTGSGSGTLRVVRDSIVGAVQAIARSGTWALVLTGPVADSATGTGAGDYRQLVRMDLASGASTVLVDRTRLPIPLYTPGDMRIANDRMRWAQLTVDDAGIVAAFNVEQGAVFGTRLQHRALTPDGRDAGALPGDPNSQTPYSVDLRP